MQQTVCSFCSAKPGKNAILIVTGEVSYDYFSWDESYRHLSGEYRKWSYNTASTWIDSVSSMRPQWPILATSQ